MSRLLPFTIAATILLASAAHAQPRLVTASPAADATVARPARIELTFSEKLAPALSGVEIVMTAMPGMPNHGPMRMTGFATQLSADGKMLVITPKAPLPAGDYRLNWHAVGGGKQRTEGSYSFKAK
jgi:methionine-rich copper-binding protein CopC